MEIRRTCWRALRFGAVAIALIVVAPLAAMADSITESFAFDTPVLPLSLGHAVYPSSSSFAKFDPALGTLDAIEIDVTGTAIWIAEFPGSDLEVALGLGAADPLHWIAEQSFSSSGAISVDTISVDLSGSCSVGDCSISIGDISYWFIGTGTAVETLYVDEGAGAASDTFATSSLMGTITYDFVPVPAPRIGSNPATTGLVVGTLALFGLARRVRRYVWKRDGGALVAGNTYGDCLGP